MTVLVVARADDEPVDIVDDSDRVVGVAPRWMMRRDRLRHRAVFVVVRSSAGELLVHRRADDKDIWPGRWDLAVGGVVSSGETYDAAARRELAEELGVDGATVVELGGGSFDDADVSLIGRCYLVVHDGPFRFVDGEISEVRWVQVEELVDMVAVSGPFVPDSVALVLPLLVAAPPG